MCRYKSLFPKFSSALLRSNKYGELFVLLSTAKEALGRVFLQPPAKMDVATVERPREGTESCKSLEAMALPFGEAVRLMARGVRRSKRSPRASAAVVTPKRRRLGCFPRASSMAKAVH